MGGGREGMLYIPIHENIVIVFVSVMFCIRVKQKFVLYIMFRPIDCVLCFFFSFIFSFRNHLTRQVQKYLRHSIFQLISFMYLSLRRGGNGRLCSFYCANIKDYVVSISRTEPLCLFINTL